MRMFLLLAVLLPAAAWGTPLPAQAPEGRIFSLGPLLDYRESTAEGFSSLSLLGPLFLRRHSGDVAETAVRPFLYRREDLRAGREEADYLYPLASSETTSEGRSIQALRGLLQIDDDFSPGGEGSSMLFPFYISGFSETHGRYRSFFPVYGNLYGRLGKDEITYLLFPLYSRTVKKGTVTRNFLYPFFSVTTGEKESGFSVWPLYGEAEKKGVYRRRFAVWPFFLSEEKGLDTADPVSRLFVLPFYASTQSGNLSSRHVLWPFFGRTEKKDPAEVENDYFWPFWLTVEGEARQVRRFLPLYSVENGRHHRQQWYLWPFYRREEIDSPDYRLQRDRILYFLFSDARENWNDGAVRRKTFLWPLFAYRRDQRGVRSLTLPAPVEPVIDREEIDRSWAPFWRLYVRRWNGSGDSASSFAWNLFWHERRGEELAWEFFPLAGYRSGANCSTDIRLLKGLFRYSSAGEEKGIGLFWIPPFLRWQGECTPPAPAAER